MPSLNYTFVGADSIDLRSEYTPLIMPGTAARVSQELASVVTKEQNGQTKNGTWNVPVTPFSQIKNYRLNALNSSLLTGSQGLMTYVNVLEDYMWTISPQYSRKRDKKLVDPPPGIIMKEKFFLVNNLIAQALYSLSSLLDVEGFGYVRGVYDELLRNTSTIGDSEQNTAVQNISPTGAVEPAGNENVREGSALSATLGVLKGTVSSIPNIFNEISEGYENYVSIFQHFTNPDLEKVLFPYQRLYILAPTGFNYKLPYLNTSVLNQRGQFSEGGAQNITADLTKLVGAGTEAAEYLGGTLRLLQQAGSAKIERAKSYDYPSEGDPIEVVFPLYNTHPATYDDICNNFKLVLLLLYQNLPLRQDKIIVEPPVVYDIQMPGNRREPYCFISSLTINYKGSTRMMNLDTKGISYTHEGIKIPSVIEAIVPDAYEIRMTLQPMIAQTKNLLFSSIQEKIIKVGEITGSTSTGTTTEEVGDGYYRKETNARTFKWAQDIVESYGEGGSYRL